MSGLRPVRVVGVGSPHGDDAAARAVLKLLREQGWHADAELTEIEGGQRLLELLDGCGSLILLDALAPNGEPGSLHRFEWPDDRLEVLRPGSTHTMRPTDALRLAGTLGLLPCRVIVWGIEGACFDPGAELGHAVAAAVPELASAVRAEVQSLMSEGNDRA